MKRQHSAFVGRKAEMGALLAEFDSALRGEGRLVFLVGEPGIGKTRTAARLAAEAEVRGARTVWGHCRAQKGSPEYWPWVQALRTCADGTEAGLGAAAAVSQLRAPHGDAEPERARFDLHDAVTRALSALARVQPLVLVLDDLQWADVGTLRLLEFALPELASVPVLVVATSRSGSPEGAVPLARGRTLPLSGLARVEIAELLGAELGAEPDAARIESVLAVTAGNPFFVIEMAQQLASGAADAGSALGFAPAGASELLIRRLAGLTASSRALLEAASVLGEEFDLGTLSRALSRPVAELVSELGGPLALGVVRASPGALRRYAFVHALLRDALRHALTPVRRAELHLAIGEALEQQLEQQAGDRAERLPALAHHFFEAARTGDPARAIHYACEAGELALEQAAFEQATLHFERAFEASSSGTAVPAEQRLRFVLGLGLARYGHDAEAGRRLQAEAVLLARALGSESFAKTVLRIAMRRTEVSLLDVDANALLEEALARLPAGPSVLRARLMARLASGLYLDRQAAFRRRELGHEAVEMARRLGDPATLGFALSRRLMSLLSPDHLADRLATVDEMLRDPATGRTAELEARLCQLDDLTESADRAGFDAAFAAFEQKVEAAPRAFFSWQLAGGRAALALLEGRFAEGEALASRALALGRRVQPESAALQFAQQILWLRGSQGRLPEVARMVEGSVEKARVVPAWRCALAGLYSHLGRDAEARREFDALAASDFEELPRDGTWITAVTLAADVCVRLEDEKRAAALHRKLLPFAGRLALGRPLVVRTSVVDLQLGTLAQLLGQLDEADAHLRAALAVAEGMRALPFQAEIKYRQAELLRARDARGNREPALALLEQSEQLAQAIGMHMLLGWIEPARAQAARAGSRLTVAVAAGGGGSRIVPERDNVVRLERSDVPERSVGTFRREGEVWTLAFGGRASRYRDMRGLGYLARLLQQPGRELHAVELAGGQARAEHGDAGMVLDARARAEYERRLREASEDLAEAERMNDRGRVEALVDEIELLRAEMARGYGIGGRARRAGSASERARVAVTRAIKYALDKIDPHDPALAEHLRRSVRTGTFCVYEPSSRDRISWIL
jgi:tetratricopeptide (TPR) repeat protein